jgi:hypothetical protein
MLFNGQPSGLSVRGREGVFAKLKGNGKIEKPLKFGVAFQILFIN